jgi:transcriptional regulator with XRE-family HTH domain
VDVHANAARRSVISWIGRILEKNKWTGTDLARQAGIAPSTVLRLLNDPTHEFVPSMRTLSRIAGTSGGGIPRDVIEAVGAFGNRDSGQSRTNNPGSIAARVIEVRRFSSLPASLRGEHLRARKARVPDQLRSDPTLFAFEMFNEDLDPVIRLGTLLFASKHRDPIKGDIVLVSTKGGRSRVRVLFDVDEGGLTLSRSLPMRGEEQIAFDEIEDLAIVVATIMGYSA